MAAAGESARKHPILYARGFSMGSYELKLILVDFHVNVTVAKHKICAKLSQQQQKHSEMRYLHHIAKFSQIRHKETFASHSSPGPRSPS